MSGSTVIIINESRMARLPDYKQKELEKLLKQIEAVVSDDEPEAPEILVEEDNNDEE